MGSLPKAKQSNGLLGSQAGRPGLLLPYSPERPEREPQGAHPSLPHKAHTG